MRNVLLIAAGALLAVGQAQAVPLMINYQGKVNVAETPYTGTGLFRFAIVDAPGTTTYWSNDGNTPPTTDVALTVEELAHIDEAFPMDAAVGTRD